MSKDIKDYVRKCQVKPWERLHFDNNERFLDVWYTPPSSNSNVSPDYQVYRATSFLYSPNVLIQDNGSQLTFKSYKELAANLRAYVKDNHKDWDKYLPQVGFALRTATHGCPPFFANFGQKMILSGDVARVDEALKSVQNSRENKGKYSESVRHVFKTSTNEGSRWFSKYWVFRWILIKICLFSNETK